MKRKILALCVVVAMLTVAIVGGTMAYFTDTDEAVNVMTMGNVKIEQNEYEREVDANGNYVMVDGEYVLKPFTQNKELLPTTAVPTHYIDLTGTESNVEGNLFLAVKDSANGDSKNLPNVIDKMITVKNTGKSDAYVRTIIAFEVTPDIVNGSHPCYTYIMTNAKSWEWNWLNADDPTKFVEVDGVYYDVAEVIYKDILSPGVETVPNLLQAYLRKEAEQIHAAGYGETFDILAISQAVQAGGFDSPKAGLDAAFGETTFDTAEAWLYTIVAANKAEEVITNPEELKQILTLAGEAGAGDTTIAISADIDLTGKTWTPVNVDGYHGADVITIDGAGHTIKGLSAPLFAGGFAGGSGIVIKNLTIEDSTIVSANTQGSGAFIECVDSMDVITLENCHLINSSVTGSRTGGLVGWTSGYDNQNDGPVDTYVTIKNCSVIECEITGTGSVGAINGHAGANPATFTTIENCIVKDCKLNSTYTSQWAVGVVVGTANIGEVTINNITASGNTLTQTGKTAPAGQSNLYGRFVPGTTGKLTIDGVAITK